jgi:serine/threonine protein kinase
MFKNCCCFLYIFRKRSTKQNTDMFSGIVLPINSHPSTTNKMGKYKINPTHEIDFKPENIKEVLGEGGASIVYKYKVDNRVIACKKLSKSLRTVKHEIKIMSSYKDNVYLPKYFGCHFENCDAEQDNNLSIPLNSCQYIFMEYCPGKELFEMLKRNYNYIRIIDIIRQLVSAISHLQKHRIIHADIKLENIIVNKHNKIKLVDFGLSRKVLKNKQSVLLNKYIGTIGYVSPEVMIDNYMTYKTDLWSVGIVCYMLINNTHLFNVVDRQSYKAQLVCLDEILTKGLFIYNNSVPNLAYVKIISFMTKTICRDETRMTTKECLNHPIFSILKRETNKF